MLISAIMITLLLIMDSYFSFWYKYARRTIDKPRFTNNRFASHDAVVKGAGVVVAFKFYFSVFWRIVWGLVAVFLAIITISETRIELLPLFPLLVSGNIVIQSVWIGFFALSLAIGIWLSTVNAHRRWKKLHVWRGEFFRPKILE